MVLNSTFQQFFSATLIVPISYMYVLSCTIAVCKYAVLLFLQHESRTTWDRSLKHREDLDMQHAACSSLN